MSTPREVIEKLFKVELKEANEQGEKIVPFILNRSQKELDNSVNSRNRKHVILKARQLGISTYVLARFLAKCLTVQGTHAVVISHERQATIKLLRKVKFMVDQLRKNGVEVNTDYDSKSEMTFPDTNSSLYIGTAGQKAFSRGDTVTDVHASEVAFWIEADELMRGVMGALTPTAEVFVESTANGAGGYFYDLCQKAAEGGGGWTFHFYPWTDEPLYRVKLPASVPIWTVEEHWLHEKSGLSWPQIMWRRKKLEDYRTLDDFLQEFPLTPEEAFIVSGTCYFDKPTLRKYQQLVREPVARGLVEMVGPTPQFNRFADKAPLWVWDYPKPGMSYVISADVSEGIEDEASDTSVAQVLNRTLFKQSAVLAGKIDPLEFAVHLYALGAYYGWAWIAVEDNGPGLAVLLKLKELGYPRIYHHRRLDMDAGRETEKIGWHTDARTRTPMLSEFRSSIKRQTYHAVDARLLKECTTFCKQKDGTYKANSGCHDDHVMSAAIGVYVHNHLPMDRMAELESQRDYYPSAPAPAVEHGGGRKTGY